ncbi:MAG: TadE/TadG family type IV pilus assembly protein [Armatimonadota bacterium]
MPLQSNSQFAGGRRGAAAVEFALVLPLLLALLFGIIEFGLVFKDQLAILQAAREGSRIAAVGRPVAEIQSRITSSASTITLASLSYDIMSRTYNNGVWSAWVTLGDKTDGSGQNDAIQGAQIRVRCNYTHRLVTGPLFANLIGRPGASTMPLYSTMVMRRE